MKHVHIILEDQEHRELRRVKGNKTWKELLMETLKGGSGSGDTGSKISG
jgi:hypothetical protein